jgi:hypothetical protein
LSLSAAACHHCGQLFGTVNGRCLLSLLSSTAAACCPCCRQRLLPVIVVVNGRSSLLMPAACHCTCCLLLLFESVKILSYLYLLSPPQCPCCNLARAFCPPWCS